MKITSEKSLSIVLPNYNGKSLLEENLPSLYQALNANQLQYEIIVVDDHSSDNSVDFLKSEYPDIVILNNKSNSGFSVTCNKGIQYANNDLVCVVNTDVTFHKNYFYHAVKYLDNPTVFAVKGDIINYVGNKENVINIEKKARIYFKRGFLRFNTNDQEGNLDYDIEYAKLGCCFIANTSLIQKLGGFDEMFSPYYWEDSDLPLRALQQGFQIIYEPRSIVYHKISSTMEATQSLLKRKIISNRNKFLFCWKHLQGRKRWTLHISFMVISLLFRWIIFDWRFYYSFIWAIKRRLAMPSWQTRTRQLKKLGQP